MPRGLSPALLDGSTGAATPRTGLAIHHVPALGGLFDGGALPAKAQALALLGGLVPVTLLELAKLLRRRDRQ